MSKYLKAIVAIAGSTLTAALALVPPDTTIWRALTITAAFFTAVGVYAVPNTPDA